MFGVDPEQIRQQRMLSQDTAATQFAQMTPQQQGAYGIYKGAGQLAGAVGGMMGMVDPQMEQAKQKQAMFQGTDLSTIEGVKAAAEKFRASGDYRTAMMLAQQAQAAEAQQIENLKNTAQASKAMRENPNLSGDAKELIDSGGIYGTPEFNEEMKRRYDAGLKAKGTNITNVMFGAKEAIDIPKFRNQVQETIKPYKVTSDAADTSLAMLDLAIKQGNPTAYQGARVQLAKAFGDSNITASEIKAAGGDPSIWGSLKDSTSTLFTGTPSVETMNSMKRTLKALKIVSERKGAAEISIQKKIAKRRDGFNDEEISELFEFPQFESKTNSPITETKTLSNGKKVTVTVKQ